MKNNGMINSQRVSLPAPSIWAELFVICSSGKRVLLVKNGSRYLSDESARKKCV